MKRRAKRLELAKLEQLLADGEELNDVQLARLELLQSAKKRENETQRVRYHNETQRLKRQVKRQKRREEAIDHEHPMIKLLVSSNKIYQPKLMQLVSDGTMKKVLMSYFVSGQTSKLSDKFLKTVDGCKEVSRFLIISCLDPHIPDLSRMKDDISCKKPLSTDNSTHAQQIFFNYSQSDSTPRSCKTQKVVHMESERCIICVLFFRSMIVSRISLFVLMTYMYL